MVIASLGTKPSMGLGTGLPIATVGRTLVNSTYITEELFIT